MPLHHGVQSFIVTRATPDGDVRIFATQDIEEAREFLSASFRIESLKPVGEDREDGYRDGKVVCSIVRTPPAGAFL